MNKNKTKRVKGGGQTPEGFISNKDVILCAETLLEVYNKREDMFSTIFSNSSNTEEMEEALNRFFDVVLPMFIAEVKNRK